MTDTEGRQALGHVLAWADSHADSMPSVIDAARSFVAALEQRVTDRDDCRRRLAECQEHASDLEQRLAAAEARPEEVSSDPPADCEHERARCDACRWPMWTEHEVEAVKTEGARLYHRFHGDEPHADCIHCQLASLRYQLSTTEAERDQWAVSAIAREEERNDLRAEREELRAEVEQERSRVKHLAQEGVNLTDRLAAAERVAEVVRTTTGCVPDDVADALDAYLALREPKETT